MRLLYTVALWLLLPYVLLRLLWRARKQPEYLSHIAERFGSYPGHDGRPLIWLHAVSVGETRATQSLVARLRAAYPGHRILLTHATPTGRAAGEQLYGDDVLRVYLPYDYPFAVRRFKVKSDSVQELSRRLWLYSRPVMAELYANVHGLDRWLSGKR